MNAKTKRMQALWRSVRPWLTISLPILVAGLLPLFLTDRGHTLLRQAENRVACSPRPEAVFEKEIFHHMNPPCSSWTHQAYSEWTNDPVAGPRYRVVPGEFSVQIDINSLGIRNHELETKKPPGVRRIVLLGDSFTFGWAVPLERTFFVLLEQGLRRRCQCDIEVWNVGAPSWGTAIHYLITKYKLPAYEPDLVIVMFDNTDLTDNVVYHEHGVFKDGELIAVPSDNLKDFDEHVRLANQDPSKDQLRIDLSSQYLRKIARLLDDRQIPMLVVFYPHNPELTDDFETQELGPIYADLTSAGIEFWSLYDQFGDRTQRSQYYFAGNKHWNEKGSAHVASILEERLCRRFPDITRCGR